MSKYAEEEEEERLQYLHCWRVMRAVRLMAVGAEQASAFELVASIA